MMWGQVSGTMNERVITDGDDAESGGREKRTEKSFPTKTGEEQLT